MSVCVESGNLEGKVFRTVIDTFDNWTKTNTLTHKVNTMIDENDEYQEKLAKALYDALVLLSHPVGDDPIVDDAYDLLQEGGYTDEYDVWIESEDFQK